MSVTHIKFVGWQICFDTHFYVRQRCVGSCWWVERVSEADRVGYSPCSKPLAVEGYLLQQMPERGRCFSSSMRQIPRARFILYLYNYLFIPVQLGASQLHTNTMGQHRAFVLWQQCHWEKDRATTWKWCCVIQNLSKWLSAQEDIVCNYVGEREKNSKNM